MRISATNGKPVKPIVYPESDGKPMADNTRQLQWIVTLLTNLVGMFRDRPDVFVSGNLMWYAVEDEPDEYVAPDVMVAFGRPKGHRGSYKQWEENDVPVTVAFEILSPKNTKKEMDDKLLFYEDHDVEEYYLYDPLKNTLRIYQRGRLALVLVQDIANYVSRRLGIRFEMTTPEMTVYRPNGQRFSTIEESEAKTEAAVKRADEAQRNLGEEKRRADDEKQRADEAERQVADEKRRADEAERKVTEAARLASALAQRMSRMGELTAKLLIGTATPDDLAELARLTTPE